MRVGSLESDEPMMSCFSFSTVTTCPMSSEEESGTYIRSGPTLEASSRSKSFHVIIVLGRPCTGTDGTRGRQRFKNINRKKKKVLPSLYDDITLEWMILPIPFRARGISSHRASGSVTDHLCVQVTVKTQDGREPLASESSVIVCTTPKRTP
ncbi:uncharacterized protein LACBIDRAFT_307078 [Laccaria bicolor S238N-H82]|uniref:Predicted protein n=1 Tax=Laccaria bicolor (strain S238N-H82 / ATCC MYA-4686) TaxID=486041 RepID=B0DPB8_LACBS|nr:uncharacterized protein LACBIDRAFT_307078 [Laccaria bicolor S238N-H82]EDR03590.1 predicted protein [Laccaria bicolor S238N-H82]|eukprot:XP_001885738.1 predicted protein [Laccaria bicolor S238N-H82]